MILLLLCAITVDRIGESLVVRTDKVYDECWLDDAQGIRTSEGWEIITPKNSGTVTMVTCTDRGCELTDYDFNLTPLWQALGLALCAGLLMNLMPCVLPVLMLKLRAFEGKRLSYVSGVMVAFMILATCSLLLGTGLSQMGFGHYRLALVVVCIVSTFVLLGVWKLPSIGMGNLGPFAMGLFTVALGSSCSVPFLAPAMAYTFSCSTLETYLIFGAIGGGFCSPFIIPGLSVPSFLRHYVNVFEKACAAGIAMVALWLSMSLSPSELSAVFFLVFAVGLFLLILEVKIGRIQKAVIGIPGVSALIFVAVLVLGTGQPDPHTIQTIPTSGSRVIFVTADWCLNCVPMRATVQSEDAVEAMQSVGIEEVVYLDYSNHAPEVRRFLESNNVRDVPFCLIVSGEKVTKLSGLWTPDAVLDALR